MRRQPRRGGVDESDAALQVQPENAIAGRAQQQLVAPVHADQLFFSALSTGDVRTHRHVAQHCLLLVDRGDAERQPVTMAVLVRAERLNREMLFPREPGPKLLAVLGILQRPEQDRCGRLAHRVVQGVPA